MATVAVFFDAEEAQIARGFLRSHGLEARLPDEQTLAAMPHMSVGLGGYRVLVPDEEAARAAELLAPTRNLSGMPACRRCGEGRVRRIRRWWFPLLIWYLLGEVFPFAPATRRLKCRQCGLVQPEPDDVLMETPA